MMLYLKMKGLFKLRVTGFLLDFSFFLIRPERDRHQDVIIESERMAETF